MKDGSGRRANRLKNIPKMDRVPMPFKKGTVRKKETMPFKEGTVRKKETMPLKITPKTKSIVKKYTKKDAERMLIKKMEKGKIKDLTKTRAKIAKITGWSPNGYTN
jgi:hypothetical protein